MALQDVSHDPSVVNWLRQSGHGHLLDDRHQSTNYPSSAPAPIYSNDYRSSDPYSDLYQRSTSFAGAENFGSQPYDAQYKRDNFMRSSAQFLAPHASQPQYDIDVENLRRDPNTRVVHRPAQDDVVYKQRVFVRYLRPPTPPVSGAIIIREKQEPPPPPDPPLVIRRAAPPPPTPPPVVIRERPPLMPPPEGTTIINKIVPPPPKPPRQVIIEQFPQLPPKPQTVIVERWLPVPPRQRRIIYERLPAPVCQPPKPPIIVQHAQPRVQLCRQVCTDPCPQRVCQQTCCSSLTSYSPHSIVQPAYGSLCDSQSNVIVMQNGGPSTISTSSYGMPLSCVCQSQTLGGLGGYAGGITTIPTMGQSCGQATVYQVPENVPVDNVLRQFGIGSQCFQPQTCVQTCTSHCC